jgi:hypothetical protein
MQKYLFLEWNNIQKLSPSEITIPHCGCGIEDRREDTYMYCFSHFSNSIILVVLVLYKKIISIRIYYCIFPNMAISEYYLILIICISSEQNSQERIKSKWK